MWHDAIFTSPHPQATRASSGQGVVPQSDGCAPLTPFRAAFEAWHGAAAYDLTREPDDRWYADERTRNALHVFTAGFWAGQNPAAKDAPK